MKMSFVVVVVGVLLISEPAQAGSCTSYSWPQQTGNSSLFSISGVASGASLDLSIDRNPVGRIRFDEVTIDGKLKTCVEIGFGMSGPSGSSSSADTAIGTVAASLHKFALMSLSLGYVLEGQVSPTSSSSIPYVWRLSIRRP